MVRRGLKIWRDSEGIRIAGPAVNFQWATIRSEDGAFR